MLCYKVLYTKLHIKYKISSTYLKNTTKRNFTLLIIYETLKNTNRTLRVIIFFIPIVTPRTPMLPIAG